MTRERSDVERQVEERMGKCVHFTGIGSDRCAAGVAYKSVQLDHDPVPYRDRDGISHTSRRSMPCIAKYNHCGAVCSRREAPTRDAAEKHVAETNKQIDATIAGLNAVSAASSKVESGSGVVDCPSCGGKLHWSKAAVNGHVWGKCETDSCLAWAM